MAFVAIVVGLVLLLPGLCSLFFGPAVFGNLRGGEYGPIGLVLWVAGVLIAGGGVALITWAVRRGFRS
jgi:hypothetical protein